MRRHFEGLDGLRAIAAALVLATHVGQLFPGARMFAAGYAGVDLFFVLSGFVIGLVYEGDLASGRLTTGAYLAKRLARLYPLIALGVVLGLVSLVATGAPVHDKAARFVAQMALLPTLWLGGHLFALNGPQWSLFFELVANALHAAFVRVFTTRRLLVLTAASGLCFALAARASGSVSLGYTVPTFLAGFPRVGFSFGAGLLLHRLWRNGRLPEFPRSGWLALPFAAAAIVLAGYAGSLYADLLLILVASPLAVAGAAGARSATLLGRLARGGGRLSYPVYALQLPAIGLLAHLLGTPGWFSYRRVALWTVLGVGMVAAAAVVDRWYDGPIQARLRRRSGAGRPPAQVSTAP